GNFGNLAWIAVAVTAGPASSSFPGCEFSHVGKIPGDFHDPRASPENLIHLDPAGGLSRRLPDSPAGDRPGSPGRQSGQEPSQPVLQPDAERVGAERGRPAADHDLWLG